MRATTRFTSLELQWVWVMKVTVAPRRVALTFAAVAQLIARRLTRLTPPSA